jgi:microcystin-dependent protein
MAVQLNTPFRESLAAFIKDHQTILDFELLFEAVLELQSYMAAVGDIVYSAGTTRTQALPANGAAVSRTTYAALFAAIGTTYGAGDGSTTFNVPDITGRVIAGKEASATRITSAVSGFSGATLGAVGGLQSHTLGSTEMPVHAHTALNSTLFGAIVGGTGAAMGAAGQAGDGYHTTANAGGSGGVTQPHRNMQPTIILNAFILY